MQPWALVIFGGILLVSVGVVLWRVASRQAQARRIPSPLRIAPAPLAPAHPIEAPKPPRSTPLLPAIEIPFDEPDDEDVDVTKVGALDAPIVQALTNLIIVDPQAAEPEGAAKAPYLLVSAAAQTDRGLRRKKNEDSVLAMPEPRVYAVADGMGGYAGGEIASELAVRTLEHAFRTNEIFGSLHEGMEPAASQLAQAVQQANVAILETAHRDTQLMGMGTTVVACKFSPSARRLFVAHVGDSRLYRMRGGALVQLTKDHTLGEFGAAGPTAALLSRAVGIRPLMPIDVLYLAPEPSDRYLLCSDGLTKMVDDAQIAEAIVEGEDPSAIVALLIDKANASGGKDNITVVLISVLASS